MHVVLVSQCYHTQRTTERHKTFEVPFVLFQTLNRFHILIVFIRYLSSWIKLRNFEEILKKIVRKCLGKFGKVFMKFLENFEEIMRKYFGNYVNFEDNLHNYKVNFGNILMKFLENFTFFNNSRFSWVHLEILSPTLQRRGVQDNCIFCKEL